MGERLAIEGVGGERGADENETARCLVESRGAEKGKGVWVVAGCSVVLAYRFGTKSDSVELGFRRVRPKGKGGGAISGECEATEDQENCSCCRIGAELQGSTVRGAAGEARWGQTGNVVRIGDGGRRRGAGQATAGREEMRRG